MNSLPLNEKAAVCSEKEFKAKADSIVTETKAKGKIVLNRGTELAGVKEKLEKIRINVEESSIEVERIINKIDRFGIDMRHAGRTVANEKPPK